MAVIPIGSMGDQPRLVLLDLKLPKVDGLEVLRQVKGDPRTKAIPIVIMTSSREERDMVKGYKLGVNAYIQKPVDFEVPGPGRPNRALLDGRQSSAALVRFFCRLRENSMQSSQHEFELPGTSDTPLRVLIVEDSQQDAELQVATLKRAGYLVQHEVAPTEDVLKEKLSREDFDIILADYNLQNWTGSGCPRHPQAKRKKHSRGDGDRQSG